jgi:Zn-dependent protease with chaperone function
MTGIPPVTGSLLLAAYAAAAGFLAPAALRRSWAVRAPRLAMGLWLALPVSWIVAVALAAFAVAAPFALSWPGSRPGDRSALLAGHAVPAGAAVAAMGLLLAAAVVLRAAACVASGLATGHRERREHAAFLEAAGRPDRTLGAVILDDDAPAAYCLPWGRHRIVVSTSAIVALGPAQLQAVLAHERAHLHGRHHLTLTVTTALARAFPRVPLLAQASAEAAVLAEMAADDAAARHHDPADLAAALVILARAGARAGALPAGGPAAMTRVQRLLAPPPRGRPARTARLAAGAAALTLSAAITCLPLIAVACDVAGRA